MVSPLFFLTISRKYVSGGRARMSQRIRLATGSGILLLLAGPLATAQAPIVTLSTKSLNFGTVEAGTMSLAQVVTLTNTGNAVLTITQLTAGSAYQLFNDGCTTVDAGASCTFGVVFQPQTAGTFSYQASIKDNAAGSPQKVQLNGTATAPVVGLSPDALTFGTQAVGTTSSVQAVTLTNQGSGTMTISSIVPSGDFAETNTCAGTVAAGKSCTISISFSPKAGGPRGGAVTINSSGNSSQNISLIGTASAGTASLSASTLSFGKENLWTSSKTKTVTLTNKGSTALQVIGVLASGDYSQTNNCGSSLEASADCTITVTFMPSATGTRTGYITVSDTDASNLQTVTLTGTGEVPSSTVSVTPGFASARSGQTVQFQASISGVLSSNVTWAVDGITGGNSTVGTITTSGLYSPPATAGGHNVQATSTANESESAIARVVATAFPGMYTNHNDIARDGQNLNEVVLTTGNVNSTQFGKLFSYSVDGYVYAQPLYVPNLSIAGQGTHDVVFVATEHDSVFAFDANNSPSTPLWQVSFIDPAAGITTVPAAAVSDSGCSNIGVEVGITGTPVIDPALNELFVVVRTLENGAYFQRLHVLDIANGTEVSGSPVVIQASVPGNGEGSYGTGTVAFNELLENSRPGLLLMNGVVYLAFSSLCDKRPYHGWVLGYDENSLAQVSVFNNSPNGIATGIWQSGNGIVGDAANGYLYYSTGNGWFDVTDGGVDYGDTVMKLSTAGNVLSVADYFTPYDQDDLNHNDLDMASGGCLLLPDQTSTPTHLLTCVGKEGNIYLINRDNMGHFNANGDTQVVETLMQGMTWGSPAYWLNQTYFWGDSDHLRAYRLDGSLFSASPVSESSRTSQYPAPTPTVSANGSTNGIVWTVFTTANLSGGPAILRAYDAANVSRQLFDSSTNSNNKAGPAVKFVVPTVADGRVYLGTQSELDVYGILP
ncbi:MAG TPA: choice-of-anchor D domain-containing protein [Candidatus Sulfotelmatobacter sp.]|nr:choice-of-anchor D domain-containing protein [Candidatus Sulfotelmatobacter sp.]